MTTVLWLCPDKLKQRRIHFPGVLCPQVLLHEHVCFNLTILSHGEKQKQCQRSGLAVALPPSWDDFFMNHPSHERKHPSSTQKVGRQKERQGAPCYCLSHWKQFVNYFNQLVTQVKCILFDQGVLCAVLLMFIFHGHWQKGKLHIEDFGEDSPGEMTVLHAQYLSSNYSIRRFLGRVASCL